MAQYQPGWKLLGQTVKRRRDRLGVTQEQVAEAGGPSTATLRLIENAQARDPRSKTLFSLDQALGWRRGSAIALVEGDIPPGGWPFEFNEFVDDLIDYVTDATREAYDVPVSPRQRHIETLDQRDHLGGQEGAAAFMKGLDQGLGIAEGPDARAASIEETQFIDMSTELDAPDPPASVDEEILPAQRTTKQLPAAPDPERAYKEILERLPLLSMEHLGTVSTVATQIQRARKADALTSLGLIPVEAVENLGMTLRHVLDRDEALVLSELVHQYRIALTAALSTNDQLTRAKRIWNYRPDDVARNRVDSVTKGHEDAVHRAGAALAAFRKAYTEALELVEDRKEKRQKTGRNK